MAADVGSGGVEAVVGGLRGMRGLGVGMGGVVGGRGGGGGLSVLPLEGGGLLGWQQPSIAR